MPTQSPLRYLLFVICLFILFLVSSCDGSQPENSESNSEVNSTETVGDSQYGESKADDLTPFKILSLYEGRYDQAPALQINFSQAVKRGQNFRDLIKVELNNVPIKGSWIVSENGRRLSFPFIEPERNYQVRVATRLEAINGKQLPQNISKTIRTGAIEAKVRFLSKGSTVIRESGVLPIEAVNVKAVDLKFWRINPSDYRKFFNNSNYRSYYQLQHLKNIGKLVHSGRFALQSESNKTQQHKINLSELDALKTNGLFAVTMQGAEDYPYEFAFNWFVISDIGIHSRSYQDRMVIFTHQLPNATPYPEVILQLMAGGEIVEETVTDRQGFAQFSSSKLQKTDFIIASRGANTNIIKLKSPQLDLSEFALTDRQQKPQELFLYGPRDLYRPGEKVFIKGLLRDSDAKLISATPIRVEVKRPDNKVFKSFNWHGDKLAFYETDFSLPLDAIRGRWSFKATLGNKDVFNHHFSVEDFLPERLKLELKAKNAKALATDKVPVIQIQSDYLYGAPASKNRFDGTLLVKAANQPFERYQDFVFGSNHYRNFDQTVDIDANNLDENGFSELALNNRWSETKFPLQLTANINVYESGGRPISRKIKQTVWPFNTAVGVRPLWKAQANRQFAMPNQNNQVELMAINTSGESIDSEPLEVTLIREDSRRYWQRGDNGWTYRESGRNIPVFSKVVKLPKQQRSNLELPLEYGNYRLEIRNASSQLLTSYKFYAGWYWSNQEGQGERPDQVQLSLNSDFVGAEKEFELAVKSPYVGTALVTIESDKLLWKKSIQLTKTEQILKIPFDSNWQTHNLYASVMVIKAGDVKRKHLPTRSFGLIHLPLDREFRKIDLQLKHPKKVRPEQEIVVDISADNFNSQEDTFVTLALVDTGVLSISDYQTPSAKDWFFEQRAYLPMLKDNYGSLIELIDGANARQRFGGDADLNRGGDAPLSDVQIVSIVADKVKLDQTGSAQVKVQLPYFNGELRLMALAFNKNNFGDNDSTVKVVAPLVVQASMPRFMAKGDQSVALVDIKNMEPTELELDLNIVTDLLLGSYKSSKKITLQPNEKQLLEIPIKAMNHRGMGYLRLNAVVNGVERNGFEGNNSEKEQISINRQWGLGLRPVYPAYVKSVQSAIDVGQEFTLNKNFASEFDSDGLKSVLTLSAKPPLNAAEHLDSLLQYPYGCLEQTSSRAWPLILVEQSDLAGFNSLNKNNVFTKRKELVDSAISRVLSMQRYDGSFGLWSNSSDEEPWLTAFVTDFLLEAKRQGYQFSEQSLNKAVKRLQAYVRSNLRVNRRYNYYHDKGHYQVAYRAYSAYVLSQINKVNLQDVRSLYDQHKDQTRTRLPLAHLAVALEKVGDQRRATEAWQKMLSFTRKTERYSYYGDYGTRVRDLSQAIDLSLKSPLVKSLKLKNLALVNELQDVVTGKQWFSTQERSALFRLAKALNKQTATGSVWSLLLEKQNAAETFKQTNDRYLHDASDSIKNAIKLENTGEQAVYLDYKVQGYPSSAPKSGSKALSVERNYFSLQGQPLRLDKVKAGDKILVHLSVSLKDPYQHLPDAMLIELLPAGFELENQNLAHSFKIDDIKIDGNLIKDLVKNNDVKHKEYRDDRFVAAMALKRHQVTNLFYMVRAITPGTYKVPATLVEDMYRPQIRTFGSQQADLVITKP